MPGIQMLYPFDYQTQAGVQWGLNTKLWNTKHIGRDSDVFYEVFVKWQKIGLNLRIPGRNLEVFVTWLSLSDNHSKVGH